MNFYLFPKLVNVRPAPIMFFKLPTMDRIYGIMLLPIIFLHFSLNRCYLNPFQDKVGSQLIPR